MPSRVNFEKVRKKFQKLDKEYQLSLKPKETEEILNQFFNRPLAYLTAKLFHRLRQSPNFVTCLSMTFGISSGFLFAQGTYHYVLAAAILLELMIIFDCADGQLARMLRQSSPLGKTLDGLADIGTHMAIFYGVAFALYREFGSIYPFFLGLVAQLSMYFHIILYDHFKNVFISVAKPDYVDKLESLEELRERSMRERNRKASGNLKWLISQLHYLFYKIENYVVSIGYPAPANNFFDLFPEPERIDSHTRDIYYREMRVSVKLWSFVGDTTHLTIFVLFGIMGRLGWIFPAIVIYMNLHTAFMLVFQRIKYKNLGLEREVFWQERFD